MQLTLLRDALLHVAQPYSHLHHADGSLYMERWFVIPRKNEDKCHLRLHHIVTADRDWHLHDHPFSFWSLVLTGGYTEARPISRTPRFYRPDPMFELLPCEVEENYQTYRSAGSIAYRHACDRHRITNVLPDTWTLVLAGPLRQWWGFYTPVGKIYWRDYESKHFTTARSERRA